MSVIRRGMESLKGDCSVLKRNITRIANRLRRDLMDPSNSASFHTTTWRELHTAYSEFTATLDEDGDTATQEFELVDLQIY